MDPLWRMNGSLYAPFFKRKTSHFQILRELAPMRSEPGYATENRIRGDRGTSARDEEKEKDRYDDNLARGALGETTMKNGPTGHDLNPRKQNRPFTSGHSSSLGTKPDRATARQARAQCAIHPSFPFPSQQVQTLHLHDPARFRTLGPEQIIL